MGRKYLLFVDANVKQVDKQESMGVALLVLLLVGLVNKVISVLSTNANDPGPCFRVQCLKPQLAHISMHMHARETADHLHGLWGKLKGGV